MRDDLKPLAQLLCDAVQVELDDVLDQPPVIRDSDRMGEAILKALDGKLHGDEYGTVWLGQPGDRENGSTDIGDLDWGPEEAMNEQWVLRVRWT